MARKSKPLTLVPTPDALPLTPEANPDVPPSKGSRKKFIKSMVTVHDRTQIETVFDYYLYRGPGKQADQDEIRYRVECYLFYPRQFGLDPTTYPKERFYTDIRPLIRFREPRLGFKQMLGLKESVRSPLLYLREYMEGLRAGRLIEPLQNAVDEARVFACSFVSNFLKNIDRKRKLFTELRACPTPEAMTEAFLKSARVVEKANGVLSAYRDLLAMGVGLPEGFAAEIRTELALVDEYCYYRLRDGIAYLMLFTQDFRAAHPHDEAVRAFMATATTLLAREDAHAEASAYIVIKADSPPATKERFVRRRGELKRRIWKVLFLDMRQRSLFAVQRQVGAMIAAGLAAVWAVLTQVLLLRRVIFDQNAGSLVGLSGIVFLTAAVLAYVVKDRIKEFGRSYFRSGLFKEVPDQSETIYYRGSSNALQAVGSLKEMAEFKTLERLPEYISVLRAKHVATLSEAEAVDQVLQYTKTITLSRGIKILGRYSLRAVHDILRLNIDACLPRLGEPTRRLNVVDAEGNVDSVEFPKVYYLDMALSYSKVQALGQEQDRSTEYFRLVLDKNGLQRVERLA